MTLATLCKQIDTQAKTLPGEEQMSLMRKYNLAWDIANLVIRGYVKPIEQAREPLNELHEAIQREWQRRADASQVS
jgi:hypothetical protein